MSDKLINPRVTDRSSRADQHIEIGVRDKLINPHITARMVEQTNTFGDSVSFITIFIAATTTTTSSC